MSLPPPLNLVSQECGPGCSAGVALERDCPARRESEATGDTPLFGERAGGEFWQGSAEVRGAAGSAGPWCVAVLSWDVRRSGWAPGLTGARIMLGRVSRG